MSALALLKGWRLSSSTKVSLNGVPARMPPFVECLLGGGQSHKADRGASEGEAVVQSRGFDANHLFLHAHHLGISVLFEAISRHAPGAGISRFTALRGPTGGPRVGAIVLRGKIADLVGGAP